jgi:hypothetical protein
MYPILKITHVLNFLDTFSMGVTRSYSWVEFYISSETVQYCAYASIFRQRKTITHVGREEECLYEVGQGFVL